MISWRETTSAATSFSSGFSGTEGRTNTNIVGTQTQVRTSQQSRSFSISENHSGTTVFTSIYNTNSSSSELINLRTISHTGSVASTLLSLTLNPDSSVGTYFYTITRPTKYVETSTTEAYSTTISITETAESSRQSWFTTTTSTNGTTSNTVISRTSATISLTTAQDEAEFTRFATTTLSQTEASGPLFNTIYQAQTHNNNGKAQVLWAITDQPMAAPYALASDYAQTTTRTTQFANTQTFAMQTTAIYDDGEESTSLWQETVLIPSVTQSISGQTTTIVTSANTSANYQATPLLAIFPPQTGTAQIITTATQSFSTSYLHAAAQTLTVLFNQSQTTIDWHRTIQAQNRDLPEANYNVLLTSWQSREITATTQNKYFLQDTFPNGSYNSSTAIGTSATQSTTGVNQVSAEGNLLASQPSATYRVNASVPENGMSIAVPQMTVHQMNGAALDNEIGYAIAITVPFVGDVISPNVEADLFPTTYTAKKHNYVTTLYPDSFWVSEVNSDGIYTASASVFLDGKSVSWTRVTGSETFTSGTAEFSTVGQSVWKQAGIYNFVIGGGDSAAWGAVVKPGAYKMIDANGTSTATTAGGLKQGYADSAPTTYFHPVSFIEPGSDSQSFPIWTALRNITELPSDF